MTKHHLRDEQIHDLTMFALSKLDLEYSTKNKAPTIIADDLTQKYVEIYNHIRSQKEPL
jgi:hypothetical protein